LARSRLRRDGNGKPGITALAQPAVGGRLRPGRDFIKSGFFDFMKNKILGVLCAFAVNKSFFKPKMLNKSKGEIGHDP
jgi:hypothetical protein